MTTNECPSSYKSLHSEHQSKTSGKTVFSSSSWGAWGACTAQLGHADMSRTLPKAAGVFEAMQLDLNSSFASYHLCDLDFLTC